MAVNLNIYDRRFFKNAKKIETPSAKETVKILYKKFKPRSVVDIGCGSGVYLAEFKKLKVKIEGYDGSPAAKKESLVKEKIKIRDLSKPLKLKKRFDLCLCIEVAEHLAANSAPAFIKTLTGLADKIVFSAATPGQGPKSIGHINERPHKYWIGLFLKCNFIFQKKLSLGIRKEMRKKKVVWWVVKNLMVFKKYEK